MNTYCLALELGKAEKYIEIKNRTRIEYSSLKSLLARRNLNLFLSLSFSIKKCAYFSNATSTFPLCECFMPPNRLFQPFFIPLNETLAKNNTIRPCSFFFSKKLIVFAPYQIWTTLLSDARHFRVHVKKHIKRTK